MHYSHGSIKAKPKHPAFTLKSKSVPTLQFAPSMTQFQLGVKAKENKTLKRESVCSKDGGDEDLRTHTLSLIIFISATEAELSYSWCLTGQVFTTDKMPLQT